MAEKDSTFQRAFDSAWFVRTSRLMMIVATLIGLPVAGFMMTRLVDKADKVIATVTATDKRVDLLEQFVRLTFERRTEQLSAIDRIIGDHESRIRIIEQASRGDPRRAPSPNEKRKKGQPRRTGPLQNHAPAWCSPD